MSDTETKPILKNSSKTQGKTVVIQTNEDVKQVKLRKSVDESNNQDQTIQVSKKHSHHNKSSKKEKQNNEKKEPKEKKKNETTIQEEKTTEISHIHKEKKYSKEKIQLQQWEQFGDHIIDMLLTSIPQSEIPSTPQQGKMAAIETLCVTLCKIVQNPKQTPTYQELETKYTKCKNQMKHMRKRCKQLHCEIQKNQQMLCQHMNSIHKKEETAVEQHLKKLEMMISEQYNTQQMQFGSFDIINKDFQINSSINTSKQRSKKLPKNSIKSAKNSISSKKKQLVAVNIEEEEECESTSTESSDIDNEEIQEDYDYDNDNEESPSGNKYEHENSIQITKIKKIRKS